MTVAMRRNTQSLDELRQEIDRIDDSLHDLLLRRAEVARAVAEAKRSEGEADTLPAGPLPPAMRPAREAQILRRLLARHQGPLPAHVIVRIWREIIASSLQLQTKFHLHVFAGENQGAFFDLAHAYFGALTPIRGHTRASLVVHACAEEIDSLGIVPSPEIEESGEPWWIQLAPAGQPGPRVVARLPFVVSGEHALCAYAVGAVEQEPSGDDTTLLRLETAPGLSRARLAARLKEIGIDAGFMAAVRGGKATPGAVLLAAKGFIAASDPRLRALRETAGGSIPRVDPIGGFANPVVLGPVVLGPVVLGPVVLGETGSMT